MPTVFIFHYSANFTIDQNLWGKATVNDLIHDAEKALNVLIQQPEVDPKRISIIGHSEGTIIAPRVAIDNSTKVKNIILMGTAAHTTFFLDLYYSLWSSDRRISKSITCLISKA